MNYYNICVSHKSARYQYNKVFMFAHVYVQVHACNQSVLYYAFGIKLLHQTCVCAYENVFLFMSVCVCL